VRDRPDGACATRSPISAGRADADRQSRQRDVLSRVRARVVAFDSPMGPTRRHRRPWMRGNLKRGKTACVCSLRTPTAFR
jgi:hypothetical protein